MFMRRLLMFDWNLNTFLLGDWQSAFRSTTSIVLGVGVLVLSVTLLIMMLSRWGEARPVAKCVVLSILAHFLLLFYAYSTNMLEPAGIAEGEQVSVQLITAGENSDIPEVREWDHADSGFVPSVVDEVSPADVSEEIPDRKVVPPPTETIADAIPLPDEVWDEIELPTPDAADVASVDESPLLPDVLDEPSPDTPAQEDLSLVDRSPPILDAPPIADAAELPISERPLPSISKDPSEMTRALASEANNFDEAEAIASNHDTLMAQAESAAGLPQQARKRTKPRVTTVATSTRVPSKYQARTGDRPEHAARHGGSESTEAAVELALVWLASAQDSRDGRWDASAHAAGRGLNHNQITEQNNSGVNADCAITGLALLAFMGAGHTHQDGPYQDNVYRGLKFLLKSQSKSSGSLAGNATHHAKMYCHGIATLALSEAYIMTQDRQLLPYLQNAIRYTIACQNPNSGGWRYRPGEEGDTSQFGWQLMALTSARTAGLDVPNRTINGMHEWLRRVSSGRSHGLASYKPRQMPSRAMTAEALVCRLFLDGGRNRNAINEAANFVAREGIGNGQLNLYYCYYGTLGLYQMQDHRWVAWNRALKAKLLPLQRSDGALAGSWDTNTVWGRNGGRVYTTSLATLCLETYYRYLPFYDLPKDRTARINSLRR